MNKVIAEKIGTKTAKQISDKTRLLNKKNKNRDKDMGIDQELVLNINDNSETENSDPEVDVVVQEIPSYKQKLLIFVTDQRLLSPDGRKSNSLSELYASDRNKSVVFDSRLDDPSKSPSLVFKCYLKSRPDFVEGLDNVAGALEYSRMPDQLAFRPEDGAGDECVVPSHQSVQDDIQEELGHLKSEDSDVEDVLGLSQQSDQSEPLLKLDIEKLQHINVPERIKELRPLSRVQFDDTEQPLVAQLVEKTFEDLKNEEYYLHEDGYPDEVDGASDHSASSVKIVRSVKSGTSIASALSDSED
ncbi:hypothetical protein chiPu_0021442 [Chiloscyllium punctatum]|uniref:Uncharacterized protein n=1 Tax=Chiloscyllium punctatum TaxID=137246 RepID=A0A401RFD2_CHIPU|nr:hypothetical protein [Chiloscyllium punctatum]